MERIPAPARAEAGTAQPYSGRIAMLDPALYIGREQTYVKHFFLKQYLERAGLQHLTRSRTTLFMSMASPGPGSRRMSATTTLRSTLRWKNCVR